MPKEANDGDDVELQSPTTHPNIDKIASADPALGPTGEDWMRPQAASEHSKLEQSTLAKKRLTGNGPPFSKVGKLVLYNRRLMDEWLLARMRNSTSEDGANDN